MTKFILYQTTDTKHLFRLPEDRIDDIRFMLSAAIAKGFTFRLLNRRQFKEEGIPTPVRVFNNVLDYWRAQI